MTEPISYDQNLVMKDPSVRYCLKQLHTGAEVVFVTYTKEIRGVIEKLWRYEIKLKERKKLIDKLRILYCFKGIFQIPVNSVLKTFPESVVKFS